MCPQPKRPLTKGVGVRLCGREDIDFSDITLQITYATPSMMTTKLAGLENKKQSRDIAHRMWKLNAVDGDGNIITVRLDSTLNSEGKLLTARAIIQITSAFAVYMDYGNLYGMRCAIVIQDCRIIVRRTVPEGISSRPPERLTVVRKPLLSNETKSNGKGCNGCTGNLCSTNGLHFVVCLSKCVPIEKVCLEKVASECVFVDRDLKDMEMRHKRFLVYYYYATSVYQFRGRGNRVELPKCIVSAVREKYPD